MSRSYVGRHRAPRQPIVPRALRGAALAGVGALAVSIAWPLGSPPEASLSVVAADIGDVYTVPPQRPAATPPPPTTAQPPVSTPRPPTARSVPSSAPVPRDVSTPVTAAPVTTDRSASTAPRSTTAPPRSSAAATTTTRRPTPSPTPSRAPAPEPARGSCSTQLQGTVPHVARSGNHIVQATGFRGTLGGRAGRARTSDHPSGHAIDFMLSDRAAGDRLAEYAVEHRRALGITYVIWRQRINSGDGWEPMADRGGATANHFDHVHVSFGRTPPEREPTC